jgi:multimeric flavodoxin WrbA
VIEKAGLDDAQEILSVINTSNREAYQGVIPGEHFREPVLSLVTYLEREAREMGLKRVRLVTVGGADWAVSFYRRLGYELAGRIERLWGFDTFMDKELRPRVVGIVGSPRKGMNTDTLVIKALEGAQSTGAETARIYLNDLEIRPCQACDRPPAIGYCFYEDGMETIYEILETVDALVIGSPAYYGSVSAQLKLLIDRSNCLTERIALSDGKVTFRSRIEKRKKGAFIWVADFARNPEHALATIRLWCKDANVELVETLIVTDADRGEGARRREDLLRRAFGLGASLVR